MSVSGDVLRSRARVAADDRRLGPVEGRAGWPWQAVLKICSTVKSKESVKAAALYIARSRPKDRPGQTVVYDETGREVRASAESVRVHLAERWRLIPDAANLSPAAVRLPAAQRSLLSPEERLNRNQAAHLVWSADGRQEPPGTLTRMRLEETTLAALDEIVTAPLGCSVFWGVHDGLVHEDGKPDHCHVHMLIELDGIGGRLRLNQGFLDGFKQALERHGRAAGLNIVFERREDRADTRLRIARGEEPLRTGHRRPGRGGGGLEVRAPGWWREHGAGAEARVRRTEELKARAKSAGGKGRLAELLKAPPKLKGGFRIFGRRPREIELPEAVQAVRRAVDGSFHDPSLASARYWDLASYGAHQNARGAWVFPLKRLADWYMERRPAVFGDIKGRALAHPLQVDVKAALRSVLHDAETPSRSCVRADAAPVVSDAENAAQSLSRLARDVAERLHDPRRALMIETRAEEVRREAARRTGAVQIQVPGRPAARFEAVPTTQKTRRPKRKERDTGR